MGVDVLILVDNEAGDVGLRAEHGLSILVSRNGTAVLFDAGSTAETLMSNAEAMGVDFSAIQAVVVSHGHYDHTGGLAAVARRHSGLPLYAHPSAFARRWVDQSGAPLKSVSCPHSVEFLRRSGFSFRPVRDPEMLFDGMLLSGRIGGPHWGREKFVVRKGDEMLRDPFEDEIFLLVQGRRGWVLVSGCCHRGLKNTLRAARFLVHGQPIAAIVGGLHLRSADEGQLAESADLLAESGEDGPPELYPCHCTGRRAVEFLARRFPARVHRVAVGSRIVF